MFFFAIKKKYANFQSLFDHFKNIANMHREHDVFLFFVLQTLRTPTCGRSSRPCPWWSPWMRISWRRFAACCSRFHWVQALGRCCHWGCHCFHAVFSHFHHFSFHQGFSPHFQCRPQGGVWCALTEGNLTQSGSQPIAPAGKNQREKESPKVTQSQFQG